jgi:hypothetical protein
MTSWTPWYTQAIIRMASTKATDLLVRLLGEKEYEIDAAWALYQLARTDSPRPSVWPRNWPMRAKDYSFAWKARSGESEVVFDEKLRAEFALVIRTHIDELLKKTTAAAELGQLNFRLNQLVLVLAEIDGNTSRDRVLEILQRPEAGKWLHSGWYRIQGLEALLMRGVVLPSPTTWGILEPVIEHVRKHYSPNDSVLLTHALCILLFTDDADGNLDRIRGILHENLLSIEGFTELTKVLGYSRCKGAVTLLRELATLGGRAQHIGRAWIDAVSQYDTEDACDLLLSFVDPTLQSVPLAIIEHYDRPMVSRLAEIARRQPRMLSRLFDLTSSELSASQAVLLGKVLAALGTEDAILSALNLFNDSGPSAVSWELHRTIEEAFVERRPYKGSTNAFTLVPRRSNRIRNRLLDMVKNDFKRRRSAYNLLSEIEFWRMENGRPDGEPRNPVCGEGVVWPPEPPM